MRRTQLDGRSVLKHWSQLSLKSVAGGFHFPNWWFLLRRLLPACFRQCFSLQLGGEKQSAFFCAIRNSALSDTAAQHYHPWLCA